MILTYKVRHGMYFARELALAKKVAIIGMNTKSLSTATVRHLGLKAVISNQVLRKYSRSKTVKSIKSVKLTVPNYHIKLRQGKIYVPCLKSWLDIHFDSGFEKINQIEFGKEFAYISVTYKDAKELEPKSFYGVDRNTTGHVLVASNPTTGKVLMLGRSCVHVHQKYSRIRKSLQRKGKFGLLKKIKHRESDIVRNINHQISKKLVDECIASNSGIVLEDLKGIREAKVKKSRRYAHYSWSYYQLEQFVLYKSKKLGVPVSYVEPQFTSQCCSRCGHIEATNRQGKLFCCKNCRTVANADVNAGFNIALLHQSGMSRFSEEKDSLKGSIDTPKGAPFA